MKGLFKYHETRIIEVNNNFFLKKAALKMLLINWYNIIKKYN
ncbi:hypothetical protein [Spiroplasma turonicum]|nr:hypothetical protein [Spiroplasma turonicum]ALX70847.1 hypothetical protein STURO_v1c05810 [Spiroplasma turonicum]